MQRVLSLILLAREGLDENEIEDILSCNDDVLNLVYEKLSSIPSTRRFPPCIWMAIKHELGAFLKTREYDRFGTHIVSFAHL